MTPDDSVDAAELALGLLDGDDRAAALRRMLAEPDFAREVERWQDHFATLLVGVRAVDPPAGTALLPANDTAAAAPWRWATVGASAIAAALAFVLVTRPAAIPPAPPVVVAATPSPLTAALAPSGPAGTSVPFAALYDVGTGEVRVAGGVTVPQGRAAQLWRIGADGVPHSLGLLRARGASVVPLGAADRAALAAGATLAISIEPPGGAPGAVPTGPVVASGKLERI